MDKHIAIFDFDGTLAHGDSFLTFSLHALGITKCFKAGILSIPTIVRWKLGKITNNQAKEQIFSRLYKGTSADFIANKAKTYRPKYKQNVLERLNSHLEQGDCVYIVSASFDLWLNEIAKSLRVQLLCTTAEITSDGIISGRFSSSNCYGKEKARRILDAEPDRRSYTLTVYGDSEGDAELWALADTVINVRERGL